MRPIAFDTETHLFGPGNMAPRVVCLSWCDGAHEKVEVGDERIGVWLDKHLRDPDVLLIGHNAAYDAVCCMATFPDLQDLWWGAYQESRVACTTIRERLLDIADGEFRRAVGGKKREYSLTSCSERRLGQKLAKGGDTWRLRYKELDGVPLSQWPKEAVEYALGDARTTFRLWQHQEQRGVQSIPSQFADARADLALRLTTVWGIRTDPVQVRKVWTETFDRMEELAPTLVADGLASPNKPRSSEMFSVERGVPKIKKSLKRIREAVLSHYPGGDPPRTPTGAVQTSAEVIAECMYEPLQRLVEFSQLQKLANTYLVKLFDPVIHASFHAVGAASDRTSSSGPNLQNQPRLPGVRECFVPRRGCVLLACDYDAQEMRTLAQSCVDIVGGSRLAERFREDPHFDPHLEFAASLLKISVEEARERKRAGDLEIKLKRQQSKAANFGYPGGMGARAFVQYAKGYGIDLTLDESQALKDRWFEQWPEMRTYFRHVGALVGQAGIATVVHPRSGFTRGMCGYCDTANSYFQTLAAHISKEAMFEVCHRCYSCSESALYGSRPVVFVHDEIILETPETGAHEAARELEEVMIEVMERWTPDVPAAASATLMRRWSKAAEPVHDAEGRLVPWED